MGSGGVTVQSDPLFAIPLPLDGDPDVDDTISQSIELGPEDHVGTDPAILYSARALDDVLEPRSDEIIRRARRIRRRAQTLRLDSLRAMGIQDERRGC